MTDRALFEEAEITTIDELDLDNDYILVINSIMGGQGLKKLSLRNVLKVDAETPAEIADGDTAITMADLAASLLTMDSSTGPRAPTVPTGTEVNAVLAVGQAINWTLINTGNQNVTLTAAAGHTLVPTSMVLATLISNTFRTVCTAVNTAITYRIY